MRFYGIDWLIKPYIKSSSLFEVSSTQRKIVDISFKVIAIKG